MTGGAVNGVRDVLGQMSLPGNGQHFGWLLRWVGWACSLDVRFVWGQVLLGRLASKMIRNRYQR